MVSIVVDIGIVAMYMTAWIISYYFSREYTGDLIKDGITQGNAIYYDYAEKGYWYYQAFIFDASSLLLIFVKMLWVFKISRQVSWMFEILESSISTILTFLIVIIPCFASFTFMVYLVFGPYVYAYRTFPDSLKAVTFFILGQQASEELYQTNSVVAVGWTYMFQAFIVFVFSSLFMAVYVTKFEVVIRDKGGYPEDFEGVHRWRYSDYLLWVVE